MIRTISLPAVFLLALLVSPFGLSAQSPRPDAESESAVGNGQFLGIFDTIKRYSLLTPADSTLWRAALDGLIEVAEGELVLGPDSAAYPRVAEVGAVNDQHFLNTFRRLSNAEPEAAPDSLLWRGALAGLIGVLNDPYAQVYSPRAVEDFREATTGNYAGIGVQISPVNDRITVTAVFRSTPAQQVGIQVGDVIVGVDGESTEGWTTGDAADHIRGTPGTMVSVSVEREGVSAPIAYPIERAQVHLSSVTAAYLDDEVGYIHLDRFARSSSAEMDSAFALLTDANGIVLDLRRNPGGLLDESLTLTDLFLERGNRIVSTRSRNPRRGPGEHEDVAFTRQPAHIGDKSLVILVDRFTASAGEILAGALQDHDRALVVGERTFGKGVVQSVIPLPDGWQFQLTTGEWYTPLGRSLHRPRDIQGRTLPEDSASLPVFTTEGGRELMGGGGVFPDLEIPDDTLLIAERRLLEEAAEAEYPLGLRIWEIGFERAQAVSRDGAEATISDEILDGFIEGVRTGGVQEATLDDPVVREYLRWRLEMTLSQRMNDDARLLRFQIQRDRVLQKAVELVQTAENQAEIFALAANDDSELIGG